MTEQTPVDLGAAGVPADAIERLAELRPGKPGSIFTSDLSVNWTCCHRPCTTPGSWP